MIWFPVGKEAIEQRLLHSQGPSDLRHRRMSWTTFGVLGGSVFVEVQLAEEENPLPLEYLFVRRCGC